MGGIEREWRPPPPLILNLLKDERRANFRIFKFFDNPLPSPEP